MPIQVSLRLFDSAEEQTIELPDNATGLTVKEWVRDTCGLEVQKQKAVVFPGDTKVLEDGDLLSSDSQFLRIKIGSLNVPQSIPSRRSGDACSQDHTFTCPGVGQV